MTRTKTLLRTLLGVGAAGAIAAFGTFSAFSSTTENPGNRLTTGTVQLTDNDVDGAAYAATGLKAGESRRKCIRVEYTGLDADVKLYIPEALGALGQYVTLSITPGTQGTANPDCTGFAPEATPLYSGSLQNFRDLHNDWDSGLADGPGSATFWANGNSVVYEVKAVVQDTNSAQNKDTLLHKLVWEARNR